MVLWSQLTALHAALMPAVLDLLTHPAFEARGHRLLGGVHVSSTATLHAFLNNHAAANGNTQPGVGTALAPGGSLHNITVSWDPRTGSRPHKRGTEVRCDSLICYV